MTICLSEKKKHLVKTTPTLPTTVFVYPKIKTEKSKLPL